jgi:protein gp37
VDLTEATWNPVTGCSKVSPGCAHCYAETITARYAGQRGWIEEHRPWTPENAGHNVRLRPERLDQPLRWRRPRMIFVNSMSDLFYEEIPYEYVRDVFNVMRRCDGGVVAATGRASPPHIFQVLTKRPERALELSRDRKLGFAHDAWPPNVWLGVSIENARYTWRADVLREIPAAVRFVSAEPLLGSLLPAKEGHALGCRHLFGGPSGTSCSVRLDLSGIDWLIVGGESGPGARPMHPDWARELRDACIDQRGYAVAVGNGPREPLPGETAFFMKQWGEWAPASDRPEWDDRMAGVPNDGRLTVDDPGLHVEVMRRVGKKAAGRLLDGRTWDEAPALREEVTA